MNCSKKFFIAFSSFVLIIGFIAGFSLSLVTWMQFVNHFSEFPFNQGLLMGATLLEPEILAQCPDINAYAFSPEYYALMSSLYIENGSNSINCWLADSVGGDPLRENLDCTIYDEQLKKAKELLNPLEE